MCELCELGNLKMHLRSGRNTFVNLFSVEMNYHDDNDGVGQMTTLDLIRWAAEIASGMVFLETRKVFKIRHHTPVPNIFSLFLEFVT